MKVPANSLLRQFSLHQAEYEQKALEVLRSGWYILGKEVASFEEEFAAFIGSKHCAGIASGLDALWMSFRLLGIGAGDEVIVASNAYIACVMGISMNNAAPVFVEPDAYENIDTSKIEAAITPKTKAILAVHLFGQACNMTDIMAVAGKHGLKVVEDCAQSHGNHWQGQTVGTFGDVGCFSFYPTKGLGAFGDAGAIVTNDAALADAFRVFRNYGSREKYHNEVVGTNSRLDELQAGLLRVRLRHIGELNAERVRIAERYQRELKSPYLRLPKVRKGADSTWHQYVVHAQHRGELIAYLNERGIGTMIHYPIPPHLSEAYAYLNYHEGDFPIAEKAAEEVLSLPMFNGITAEEQGFVIESLNAFSPGESAAEPMI